MRAILAVLFAVVLAACGDQQMEQVQVGMDAEQVVKIMGRPNGVQTNGNQTSMSWTNRLMSGWSWDRADYHVLLTDGKVTHYGTGTIRQAPVSYGYSWIFIPRYR